MIREVRLECVTRAGVELGELTDATLDGVTWELNGPGSIGYTMNQDNARIALPQENINEVQLWVESIDPNKPLHWGFHHKTQETDKTCVFDCPGLLQYFNHRYILNASLGPYDNVEQQLIATTVVQAMQSAPYLGWNIGIGSYVPSPVYRFREYKREEHQNVLDILQEFPTLTNALGAPTGFDFDIVLTSTSRLFTPYYPSKGVVRTSPILEYGKNIIKFTVSKDGGEQVNRSYVTGGSDGEVQYEGNFADPSGTLATYGEWDAVDSVSSEADVTTLLEIAQNTVAEKKYPLVTPEVEVVEVPDQLLGVIFVGDWVPVVINQGRTQINGSYRIRSITWKPGLGNLQLTLGRT